MTMQEAEGARVTIGELLERIALADRLAEAAGPAISQLFSYDHAPGIRVAIPLKKALAAYRSTKKEGEQDEEV
jgi:hypothetical protein